MKRRIRSGASGVVLLGALAILPLACAGKSTETESTTSTGGSAGSAGAPGNAGQAGAALPPPTRTPVNRFPCLAPNSLAPNPLEVGLENCGTYTRRTGAVSCDNTCADSCTFGCFADSSCPANQGCDCASYPSSCVPIGCVSDADCAAGYNCASYSFDCGNSGYACQLPADECVSNIDCDNGRECSYTTAGRKCTPAPDCLQ